MKIPGKLYFSHFLFFVLEWCIGHLRMSCCCKIPLKKDIIMQKGTLCHYGRLKDEFKLSLVTVHCSGC